MKYFSVLACTTIALTGISMMAPSQAGCVDCPTGVKCMSDFNCNTWQCNLRCVKIDKVGFEKRCLVVAN